MTQLARADLTPGVLVDGVTVETLREPRYAESVRPGRWQSARLKVQAMKRYGISYLLVHRYVLDHLIPLEAGGHPTDPGNLWPQPKAESHLKDADEASARLRIFTGLNTIESAADWMRARWVAPA